MISIVVPVFNEEENLEELNKRLLSVCNSLPINFEIIYVDDGSTDKSLDIVKNFCNLNDFIHFISFYRNFGQHAAVMAGFKYARGDLIMTLDADLQNPPEEIIKLIDKMKDGYDIVAGKRINRKDSFLRKIPSYFMNRIISSLTGVKLSDYGCMMRVYKRDIISNLLEYGEKSLYIPAFTSWLSNHSTEIPIKHDTRYAGKSKYTLFTLLRQAFDLITAYTLVPIQLIGMTGIIFFIIGLFLFMYLMYYRLFIGSPSSLTSFIAILILLSGVILFSIGVISEYLVRIHKEVRKMPLYILKESDIYNKDS